MHFSNVRAGACLRSAIAAAALLTCMMARGAECTRAGLAALTDNYLAALAAHNPSTLPLAPTVKYTENSKILKVGEGLWTTAGQVAFQRKLLDTERCGTLVQAVIEEAGMAKPTILGVRLQLADGKIGEIESYIARAQEFAHKPEGVALEDGEDWEAIVPQNERTSREAMQAAADAYFVMFDIPGTQVPFATPCNRYENGTKTTRGDCSNMGPAGGGGLKMTHRRYPLSDLEAGITAGFVLFVNKLSDFHMFKFRNGKITQIQAVVGPATTTTGWEEQER